MSKSVRIGNTQVGDGEPCFIVAEIGINHNGPIFGDSEVSQGQVFANNLGQAIMTASSMTASRTTSNSMMT